MEGFLDFHALSATTPAPILVCDRSTQTLGSTRASYGTKCASALHFKAREIIPRCPLVCKSGTNSAIAIRTQSLMQKKKPTQKQSRHPEELLSAAAPSRWRRFAHLRTLQVTKRRRTWSFSQYYFIPSLVFLCVCVFNRGSIITPPVHNPPTAHPDGSVCFSHRELLYLCLIFLYFFYLLHYVVYNTVVCICINTIIYFSMDKNRKVRLRPTEGCF